MRDLGFEIHVVRHLVHAEFSQYYHDTNNQFFHRKEQSHLNNPVLFLLIALALIVQNSEPHHHEVTITIYRNVEVIDISDNERFMSFKGQLIQEWAKQSVMHTLELYSKLKCNRFIFLSEQSGLDLEVYNIRNIYDHVQRTIYICVSIYRVWTANKP